MKSKKQVTKVAQKATKAGKKAARTVDMRLSKNSETYGAIKHSEIPGAVKRDIKRITKRSQEKLAEAGNLIDEYIRDNPKKSLAIAAGVGAAVGAGTSRALKKNKRSKHKDKKSSRTS